MAGADYTECGIKFDLEDTGPPPYLLLQLDEAATNSDDEEEVTKRKLLAWTRAVAASMANLLPGFHE
ncbi:hypothetical protein ACLOJK_013355 [Asimina triloba]